MYKLQTVMDGNPKISLSKGFDLTYKDFLEKFERH
jgi:hypothetical protein